MTVQYTWLDARGKTRTALGVDRVTGDGLNEGLGGVPAAGSDSSAGGA